MAREGSRYAAAEKVTMVSTLDNFVRRDVIPPTR